MGSLGLGLPLWVVALPPVVAVSALMLYVSSSERRRDARVRATLILAVCVTAIEAMLVALALVFLLILALTGPIEDF